MKNIIWYYYQLKCDEVIEQNGEFAIYSENDEYVFKELKIPLEVLKQVSEQLYYHQIAGYLLVINKDGELITNFNQKQYVLLKRGKLLTNNYVDLTVIQVKKDKNNIGFIWAQKIDYYMLQIKELGINKELLINSFNYYIGMAENAIGMANRINENTSEFIYVIQHSRIKANFSAKEYYDPTTMVIDLRVRDISEFIKDKFFTSNIRVEEVNKAVSRYNFDESEMNMLYARLLYPTYYFDLFEDMIIDKEDENKILKILKRRKQYEKFLRNFYEYFKKKNNLFEIEWLKKEL